MMMNDILILVLVLMFIALFITISFSINNLKSSKENSDLKSINNLYSIVAVNLTCLILIALFNVLLYKLLAGIISDALAVVITLFAGNLVLTVLAVLPVLTITEAKPEKIVAFFSKLIIFITYLLLPLTVVYVGVRKLIYRPNNTKMTEDQFLDIIDKAEQEESINEAERDLIKSVLDFDDLKVADIYTPRIDIIAAEKKMTNDDIIKKFKSSGYSRLPIYDEDIDTIIGTINHKDFYNSVLIDKKTISSIMQTPVEVPEYMEIKNLLTLLKKNKSHMAIVKDEFGGTLGIVTMEDILEELVGDIWDEHDKVLESIKQVDENRYIVLGSAYLDDLEDIIDLKLFEDEDYYTVNGWVLANLGKMGQKGDSFEFHNITVTVVKASNKKILEVEILINSLIEEE